jgi:hypothetical protein
MRVVLEAGGDAIQQNHKESSPYITVAEDRLLPGRWQIGWAVVVDMT